MLDIFLTNREQVLATARELKAIVNEFCEMLAANDETSLKRFLDEAIQQRRDLEA